MRGVISRTISLGNQIRSHLLLLILLFGLFVVSCGVALALVTSDSFDENLSVQIMGVGADALVTVFIVDQLLKSRERARWSGPRIQFLRQLQGLTFTGLPQFWDSLGSIHQMLHKGVSSDLVESCMELGIEAHLLPMPNLTAAGIRSLRRWPNETLVPTADWSVDELRGCANRLLNLHRGLIEFAGRVVSFQLLSSRFVDDDPQLYSLLTTVGQTFINSWDFTFVGPWPDQSDEFNAKVLLGACITGLLASYRVLWRLNTYVQTLLGADVDEDPFHLQTDA